MPKDKMYSYQHTVSFDYSEKFLTALLKTQDTAIKLSVTYLTEPIKEIVSSPDYDDKALATALLLNAYMALRTKRSEKKAKWLFYSLANFAQERIDNDQKKNKKSLN